MHPPRNHSAEQGALGTLWCGLMHGSPSWPINGHYHCAKCGRLYAVPWAGPATVEEGQVRPDARHFLRIAGSVVVILAAGIMAAPLHAAASLPSTPESGAAIAYRKYLAYQQTARPWNIETVEVEASLPQVAKNGRLIAIRRLLPFGRPEYKVLELSGDQTVRQQVIGRYLKAEIRASEIPAAAVALLPANYKFRYKESLTYQGRLVYAFQITPRKKRDGLIKGELWLDGETGVAVRESGYLVRKPSLFVKRVDVTRETSVRDGTVDAHVTHMSVVTRLFGRAELVVQEHPYQEAGDASPAIAGGEGNDNL